MRAHVRIPVQDVERAISDPAFRAYLIQTAEEAMQKMASAEGRKLSSAPEFMDAYESRIAPQIVYMEFEANTIPK